MRKLIPEKLNNTGFSFIFGIISFVMFVITQMISSDVETSKWVTLVRIVVITVSVICYLICYNLSRVNPKYRRQIAWINIWNLLFHLLYCIVAFRTALAIRYYSVLYMEIVWLIAISLVLWDSRCVILDSLRSVKNNDTKFYLLLSLFFSIILILLSYDVGGPHFVWDARSFYDWLSILETTDVFSIEKFFIFGHVDLTYFFSVFLLWKISNSLSAGFFIYGAICIVVASFAVVFIVGKTLSHNGRLFVALASSACLFSPYICGMSTYITYDFAICCFAPLLILFAIKEEWLYFLLTGFYISQMKETGIILVGAVCLGVIAKECLCDRVSIKRSIIRKRTVGQLMIAGIFALFFIRYSSWGKTNLESGGGFFGFDWSHIKAVLKIFLVLNYEWVIVLVLVTLLTVAFIKNRSIPQNAVLYSVTAILFLLFNLVYVTATYPRYTEAFPVCIMILFVTVLSSMDLKLCVRNTVLSLTTILMIISSFVSVDPISDILFKTEKVGNSSIYFSAKDFDFGGDPCVYNRHYYGMDIVLDKALKKGLESDVDVIAVSNGNNTSTWAIDGGMYAYSEHDDKRVFTEFWNNKRDTRDPIYQWEYYDNPDYTRMDIRYIFPTDDLISALQCNGNFIYIYLPTQNGGREEVVQESFAITEEGSFSSHGWVISYMVGSTKKGRIIKNERN